MDIPGRAWARFRGLPMWAQIALGFFVLVLLAGPFASSDVDKDESVATRTGDTAAAAGTGRRAGCIEVTNRELEDELSSSDMWAAKADGELGRSGAQAWYVSNAYGATWVTNIQPDQPPDAGLIYPMNQTARTMSDVGVDVGQDARIRSDFSDSDASAARSRSCAAADPAAP